ncbi:MAG: RNA-binding S4 domain-containing protein [Flavobacteriales bacterium]|nr:RNA-binding S4 domain-containing protein [Flavobacteriales bacterium]
MRIDKFLWCVRLARTRSEATGFCSNGKVMIDDEIVKPSKMIYPNAVLKFKVNPIWRSFKIIEIPKSRVGAKLVNTLIIETTTQADLDLIHQIAQTNRENRSQGLKGRPTKKDRRDLDDWTN